MLSIRRSAPIPIDANGSRRLKAVALFSPTLKEDDEDEEKNEKEIESEEEDEIEGEVDEDAFNPYLFIAGLPQHSLVAVKGIWIKFLADIL